MDEAKGEKAISEWRDSFQRLGDLLEVRIA
jgi:hypothetical protein